MLSSDDDSLLMIHEYGLLSTGLMFLPVVSKGLSYNSRSEYLSQWLSDCELPSCLRVETDCVSSWCPENPA